MDENFIDSKWIIQGEEYSGKLTCDKDNGLIEVKIVYYDDNPFTWEGKLIRFDEMRGIINGRTKCVITNCEVIALLSQNVCKHFVTIRGKTIFFDTEKDKKEDLKFNVCDFQLSNTLRWTGLSGLDFARDYDGYDYIFKYQYKDAVSLVLDLNTKLEFISYIDRISTDFEAEEYKIKQYVMVRISKNTETYYEEFFNDINKVIQLIMIATGCNVSIANISCYNFDDFYFDTNKCYKEFEVVDYRMKRHVDNFIRDSISNDYLFDLSSLVQSNCLKKWFELYDDYQCVYDLYLLSIKTSVPLEIKFCNYIQAMELLHRKKYKNIKSFEKHIRGKLSKRDYLINEILNHPDQKNSKYITNRSRMIDIFTDDNKLLNCDIVFENVVLFSEIMTDTRNYYTHYDDSKKNKALSGLNLEFAVDILEYIIAFSIMRILGLDSTFIDFKLEDKENRIMYGRMLESIIDKR